MPKGQYAKLHGAVINIPLKAGETFKFLPNIENILLNLKGNPNYQGILS